MRQLLIEFDGSEEERQARNFQSRMPSSFFFFLPILILSGRKRRKKKRAGKQIRIASAMLLDITCSKSLPTSPHSSYIASRDGHEFRDSSAAKEG